MFIPHPFEPVHDRLTLKLLIIAWHLLRTFAAEAADALAVDDERRAREIRGLLRKASPCGQVLTEA
jgi:hypothetical protein